MTQFRFLQRPLHETLPLGLFFFLICLKIMEKLCLKKNLALESFFNVNLVRLEHRLFYLSCEVVQIILISSAIIIPIRYFLIQPFMSKGKYGTQFL